MQSAKLLRALLRHWQIRADIVAFIGAPKDVWVQLRSHIPTGCLDREISRRTDWVGIFPTRDPVVRLAGLGGRGP